MMIKKLYLCYGGQVHLKKGHQSVPLQEPSVQLAFHDNPIQENNESDNL